MIERLSDKLNSLIWFLEDIKNGDIKKCELNGNLVYFVYYDVAVLLSSGLGLRFEINPEDEKMCGFLVSDIEKINSDEVIEKVKIANEKIANLEIEYVDINKTLIKNRLQMKSERKNLIKRMKNE